MTAEVSPERLSPAVPLGCVPGVLQRLLEILPVQMMVGTTQLTPGSAASVIMICSSASLTDVAIVIGPIFVVIALPIVVTSSRVLFAAPGLVASISLGPILPAIAIPRLVSTATWGFIAVSISLGPILPAIAIPKVISTAICFPGILVRQWI